MKRYEIVPSRYWYNARTMAKASMFGACPWVDDLDKVNWSLINAGYTIRDTRTGTVGQGKAPAKTLEEAESILQALEALDRR